MRKVIKGSNSKQDAVVSNHLPGDGTDSFKVEYDYEANQYIVTINSIERGLDRSNSYEIGPEDQSKLISMFNDWLEHDE
jgi:hypothetical protein